MRGQPLTAQEILENAVRFELLAPDRGLTMHKTLQARITEDIQDKRQKSRFIRTAKGVYYLRRLWRGGASLPKISNFKGRRRPQPAYRVLHVPKALVERPQKQRNLREAILHSDHLDYLPLGSSNLVPVAILLFIIFKSEILIHEVGQHSYFTDIVGSQTPAYRSYVDEFDADLFFSNEYGLPVSAVRELIRNVAIPESVASQLLSNEQTLFRAGPAAKDIHGNRVLISASIDLARVMPSKPKIIRRLDINNPLWIPISSLGNLPEIQFYELLAQGIGDGKI